MCRIRDFHAEDAPLLPSMPDETAAIGGSFTLPRPTLPNLPPTAGDIASDRSSANRTVAWDGLHSLQMCPDQVRDTAGACVAT